MCFQVNKNFTRGSLDKGMLRFFSVGPQNDSLVELVDLVAVKSGVKSGNKNGRSTLVAPAITPQTLKESK